MTVVAIRPTVTEGATDPEALLYLPDASNELIGMIVESAWPTADDGHLTPVDASDAFTEAQPSRQSSGCRQGRERQAGTDCGRLQVNGGPLQTQTFEVTVRVCFDLPVDQRCGDQP